MDPGRGLDVQIARPAGRPLGLAVGRDAPHGPREIHVLTDHPTQADLPPVSARRRPDGTLELCVGLRDDDLEPAWLALAPGGHAVVIGPPRSGRTTALARLADAARRPAPGLDLAVVAVTRLGSPWAARADLVISPDDPDLVAAIRGMERGGQTILVVVDDADTTEETHAGLTGLVADRHPDRHLVVSGRADRMRNRYRHWARETAADRTGLLLQPDPDLDGDLLGVALPRRTSVTWVPGRAWLVGDGRLAIVQVAAPDRD